MKEVKTKRIRYFSPVNEGHRAFAIWMADFTKEEIEALFVNPVDYSEEPAQGVVSSEETKRESKVRKENYARSVRAQNNYEELSAKILSLEGFGDIQVPLLNAEMKPIVKAALVMEAERTRKIELFYKIEVVAPDYLQEVIRDKAKRKKKKKVSFADAPTIHLFKPNNPIVEQLRSKQAEKASVVSRFTAKSESAANQDQKKPAVSFTFKFKPKDFDFFQANPGEVLKKASPHGFNLLEKKEDAIRVKDDNGNYIDLFKDGSLQSSGYVIGQDNYQKVATAMYGVAMAMLDIRIALCGDDLKKGDFDFSFSDTGNELSREMVKTLLKNKIKESLADAKYDIIRSLVTFDGEVLIKPLPPKEKEGFGRNEPEGLKMGR